MRIIFGSRVLWAICCVCLTLAIYGRIFFPPLSLGAGDPDRYFHLWVAQETAARGLLHAIPQVDNLGWALNFPDKEFFFHLLAAFGYKIHGEWGALGLVPAFVVALILILYFSFCSKNLFNLPPWLAFLISVFPVLGAAPFTFRLFLFRPHILGIFFWVANLVGLFSSRRWLTFVGSVLFALSYHAFYMPLILAFTYAVVQIVMHLRVNWRLILMVPAGLLVGTIVNPYFPDNAVMGWLHLKIALGVLPYMNRGQELNPLPIMETLALAKFQLITLVSSLAYAVCLSRVGAKDPFKFYFVLFLSVLLGTMCLKSPRANEYWLPVSAFLLAAFCSVLLERLPGKLEKRCFAAPLLCLAFLGPGAFDFYRDVLRTRYIGPTQAVFDALSLVPERAAGEKIFNCNWTDGSFILYRRPDLRFVDLLEPAFLYDYSPEAHRLRVDLNAGHYPKPAGSIVRAFRSRYVVCDNPILNGLLARDEGARELSSTKLPLSHERTFELLGELPK
jgi:hypothetical protein